MVRVWIEDHSVTLPIADVVSKGLNQLFADVAATTEKFKEVVDFSLYRLIYCCQELREENLKTLTDDDSIRVVPYIRPERPPFPTERYINDVDAGMASMTEAYSDPDDRSLYAFNQEFAQPGHIKKIVELFPKLINDSHLLSIFKDFNFFSAYVLSNAYEDDPARNSFKYENLDYFRAARHLIYSIAEKYGLNQVQIPRVPNLNAGAPITQQLLQDALQAALSGNLANIMGQQLGAHQAPQAGSSGGVLPQSSQSAPTSSAASAPVQPTDRMEQGYEQEVALLRSFGFENDELILLALQEANGDLDQALAFLVEMNN